MLSVFSTLDQSPERGFKGRDQVSHGQHPPTGLAPLERGTPSSNGPYRLRRVRGGKCKVLVICKSLEIDPTITHIHGSSWRERGTGLHVSGDHVSVHFKKKRKCVFRRLSKYKPKRWILLKGFLTIDSVILKCVCVCVCVCVVYYKV